MLAGLTKNMGKRGQNIHDSFLNNAREDKTNLTIYLVKGVKLSGRVKRLDKYALVLETKNQEQLIFKHAISTVLPQTLLPQSYPLVPATNREVDFERSPKERNGCPTTTSDGIDL